MLWPTTVLNRGAGGASFHAAERSARRGCDSQRVSGSVDRAKRHQLAGPYVTSFDMPRGRRRGQQFQDLPSGALLAGKQLNPHTDGPSR